MNWKNEKEKIENLILNEDKTYVEIGKMYGVSDTTIRKVAKKLGILLPKRRKINDKETFNKGTKRKEKICLNCGKTLINAQKKFCSNECQTEYNSLDKLNNWLNGTNYTKGATQTPSFIRRYLMKKYSNKCQKCGWGEVSEYTGKIPLEIHHIDGDCTNNSEDNLELLCPNCHSLTNNFGILNKNSKRFHKSKITK